MYNSKAKRAHKLNKLKINVLISCYVLFSCHGQISITMYRFFFLILSDAWMLIAELNAIESCMDLGDY